MKHLYLLLCLPVFFLSLPTLQAQSPALIYHSPADYFRHISDSAGGIRVERRSLTRIFMEGGNDYKPYSRKKALNKQIKQEVWGIECNDSLFINCNPLNCGPWYAYAQKIEDRLFFKAAISLKKDDKQSADSTATAAVTAGTGIAGGDLALIRVFYTIGFKTGSVELLSKEMMQGLIAGFPALAGRYKREESPEDVYVLGDYLEAYSVLSGGKKGNIQ